MSLLQLSRFETVSSLAFLSQVYKAVPKWGYAVFRRKIHKTRQGRLTKLRSASQRDLIIAIKFESQQSSGLLGKAALFQICDTQQFRGQLYVDGFHSSKLPHARQFVMRYRLPVALAAVEGHARWRGSLDCGCATGLPQRSLRGRC